MTVSLYETNIKYELWVKILLAFPVVLVMVMGIFFYNTYRAQDELAAVAAHGFYAASIILFATGPFILFIYWLVLPTKICIQQDRIRIKYGRFYWNVRFETVESVKEASGIPPAWSHSSVTSYRNQIEIVRKKKMNIRLSPDNRERFLDRANRALADWKRMQGS
jgi:hypothetical protein